MDVYTLLCLNGQPAGRSTGNSAPRYAEWEGRGVGGEATVTCACMAGAFAVHLQLSQHCVLIAYTPIQNPKGKKKELLFKKRKFTEGPQDLPAFQPITNRTARARGEGWKVWGGSSDGPAAGPPQQA